MPKQNEIADVPVTIFSIRGVKDYVYGTVADIPCDVLTHTHITQSDYVRLVQARIEGNVSTLLSVSYNI